jgi:uncharacterized protein YjbI with pentapeptide repeats
MIIDYDLTVDDLITELMNGKRYFSKIDFGLGSISNYDMEAVVFEECFLAVEFQNVNLKNARFINSCIKTCIFNNVNLADAEIVNCSVESVIIKDSNLEGLIFENNFSYGHTLSQCDLEKLIG